MAHRSRPVQRQLHQRRPRQRARAWAMAITLPRMLRCDCATRRITVQESQPSLRAGTVVLVTGSAVGGFYPVNWDGLKGYMHGDYLTETSAALSVRGGSASQPSTPPSNTSSGSVGWQQHCRLRTPVCWVSICLGDPRTVQFRLLRFHELGDQECHWQGDLVQRRLTVGLRHTGES